MNIPDYVYPLIGHRVWDWDGSKLISLINHAPWPIGRPLAARCYAHLHLGGRSVVEHQSHQAPQIDCSCGIYATKGPAAGYGIGVISGEVYLWGTVVEHEFGWRAQYAYPKTLMLFPEGFLLRRWARDHQPFREPVPEVERCLGTLQAYGADISMTARGEQVPLWTKHSGYDPQGLERLRNLASADLDGLFGLIAGQRTRNAGALLLSLNNILRWRKTIPKKPPGPPPPPPAIPVHSTADIIRITQSRQRNWPRAVEYRIGVERMEDL